MLPSQVSSQESERIKKRFYISGEDEYSCSSDPLNGLVFSMILDAMPSYASSRSRALKEGYIADLIREGGVSPCTLLLGMIYIRRLTLTNQEYLATVSSRDLFLVAMLVASKFMNDEGELEALTNSEWSAVGCTPKATVDHLEREFLKAIDWRLYVPIDEFYAFVGSVEGRVAMEQACKRGWMTYTDLAAVWEDSDLQVSMLKHTAKVAFSGVTLYLVCVSTLMAALQPLALFASDVSPTHQLQSDSLLPPANTQVGQMVSQMMAGPHLPPVSTVADAPPPWEEAWPPNRRSFGNETPAMLNTTRASTRWHPYNSTPPGDMPPGLNRDMPPGLNRDMPPGLNRDMPPGLNRDVPPGLTRNRHTSPGLAHKHTPPGVYPDTPPDFNPDGNMPPTISDGQHDMLGNVLGTNGRHEHATTHHRTTVAGSLHNITTPSSFCMHTRVKSLQSLAKVEALQAQDLGYHQKGTFHWDPFINSSSLNTSMTGALTFIVQHYLTPRWN